MVKSRRTLGTRGFFLANVGRNRPKADATSGHGREHNKLQPETAQEKPLAPRVEKAQNVKLCNCQVNTGWSVILSSNSYLGGSLQQPPNGKTL